MSPIKFDGSLFKRATFFTITFHAWRNRRKANLDRVNTDAEKKMLSLTKRLIVSKEYDKITKFMSETRQWCLNRSMPSFLKDGIYVVNLSEVKKFEKFLTKRITELEKKLLPKFLNEYPGQREKAKEELQSLFNENDYPPVEAVRRAFGIEWSWITFEVPDNLPKEIREKEAKKLTEKYQQAQQEIVAALRVGFQEIVSHAIERLTVKPGEQPKKFKDSLVENFKEFFDTFNARNLMNDEELSAIVGKAQKVLGNLDAKTLRDNTKTRKLVTMELSDVKKEIDRMVVETPSRKFTFDEE